MVVIHEIGSQKVANKIFFNEGAKGDFWRYYYVKTTALLFFEVFNAINFLFSKYPKDSVEKLKNDFKQYKLGPSNPLMNQMRLIRNTIHFDKNSFLFEYLENEQQYILLSIQGWNKLDNLYEYLVAITDVKGQSVPLINS